MKSLPEIIIIRYDDKHCSEVIYKKSRWDCGYFNQTKQKCLIKSESEKEILAAIKIFCELWIDKDKIFFEFDNGKKKIKTFLDAAGMLKEMSK